MVGAVEWESSKISRNNLWSYVTELWNRQVQTDVTVPNNKPDMITREKENRNSRFCNSKTRKPYQERSRYNSEL